MRRQRVVLPILNFERAYIKAEAPQDSIGWTFTFSHLYKRR